MAVSILPGERHFRRSPLLGLVLGACASLALTAAIAPAAASACSSLANVKSFSGHAGLRFNATASGEDPGNGGTETIALSRQASSVEIHLTHRKLSGGYALFTGKVSGGTVTVDDTFVDTGSTLSGKETYSGPLTNKPPNYGTAFLALDQSTCSYQLTLGYGVATNFQGDEQINPGTSAGASAYSEMEAIPKDFHLIGGAGPDADINTCPDPRTTKMSCYDFGGGFAVDFGTLFECHSVVASSCESGGQIPGSTSFIWVLLPTYKHGKHKGTSKR